uniref:PAN2-PAN3 deadenylation complex subunit PAN3 n=1 Tax=Cacopsylla melanoneura TaxID=428564 RepID=A0A8D8SJM5_9HEMI
MDLDPVYLPYAQVNGVPQESKLATYMKRPPDSTMAQSLSKNVSSMSLEPLLSMKKVLASSSEFVPRNSVTTFANRLVDTNTVSPQPNTPSPTLGQSILSPTPHSLVDKNLPTYQENFGGTTYFYQAPSGSGDVSGPSGAAPSEDLTAGGPSVQSSSPGYTLHPGTPPHVRHKMGAPPNPTVDNSSFYMSENIRAEIQHKNALTLVSANPELFPELPLEVDNYHDLVPLEQIPTGIKPNMIGYLTSTYKATNIKSGSRYCLRRVHNFRLPSSKCLVFVDMWKKLAHSNIVQLREVFTTKAFGDHSIVFVYDYHPNSETLLSKHFSQSEQMNNYDGFSSNPLAPRPYSHSKNTLLRQQHSSLLSESTIWSYIIQLTGALRVIHSSGLACRCLDPSKVLLTGLSRSRLRLSGVCVSDVLTFDTSQSNPHSMIAAYQQDDLTALGKLILAMTCRSLMAVQRENLQTSIELMSRSYSMDLRNLVLYLLTVHQKRTVVDLMPMIGARYYTQLDAVQLHGDSLENELAKEMENGRLFRLLVKLGTINERPELNLDPTWSETGDRYMLKLFRDYLLHQVQEDGRPWLDMSHIVHCLNKLDAGTQEKICLMSRDEQSVLVVSYAELKQCLDQSFLELSSAAALTPKSTLPL